jgi:tripartite-type tricarboxylate transporter receptor subunit TctC
MKMKRVPCIGLCVAALAAAPGAFPQDYPARPVHVVVPYAPGGAVDLTARLMQQRLSEALGQPFVVENKPGAAGHVGAEAVSRAVPDGYTLLYTVGAELAMRQSRPGSIDPLRDLTPIASTVASVSCIAVRASLPVDSIGKLIGYARRNPGKLTYGTAGIASTQHLTGEHMKRYGVDMVHVPFKGVAPAMTALVSGEIDVSVTNLATALPQVRQGKIKLLAVTQARRFEGARAIPAIDEALPGFDMPVAWYGFFGPPNLPGPIVAKLAAAIGKSLEASVLKEKITEGAMSVVFTGPERFPDFIRETASAYGRVIQATGVQLD